MTVDLRHGNCLDILPTLPDCSVDSIVTDPPYELGFMGKKWDNSGIAYNVTLWQECLRVLKPGGHLLAFGGTRTYHRMACAIEDAGFEIRDSIHWLYGSGFPKSLDVSKAIDKRGGNVAGFEQFCDAVKEAMELNGVSRSALTKALGNHMLSHYLTAGSQPAVPNARDYRIIRDTVGLGNYWDDLFLDEAEREIIGKREVPVGHSFAGQTYGGDSSNIEVDITVPATEQAKQWAGWGTALKPAHEPIVVARKPLIGTVAANVLEYGTGAINIDASRIGHASEADLAESLAKNPGRGDTVTSDVYGANRPQQSVNSAGRWPANVILSHHEDCDTECVPGCAVAELDRQSGVSKSTQNQSGDGRIRNSVFGGGEKSGGFRTPNNSHGDTGGASRFFYCAKPSRRERNAGLNELPAIFSPTMNDGIGAKPHNPETATRKQNHHPTVKPLALMRYLVRLVTPPGGTVLEPFAGSGTTLMACVLEGFHAIGIEMTDEYLPIIQGRIAWAEEEASKESPQQELEL